MIAIWKKVGKEPFIARYIAGIPEENNTCLHPLYRREYIVSIGIVPNSGVKIWKINQILYEELSEHKINPKTSLASAAFIDRYKNEYCQKKVKYNRISREKLGSSNLTDENEVPAGKTEEEAITNWNRRI
jgi:hypothetical protein